jgi:hypothetical protein
MCKLSSFGFLGHRPCWVFLERIPIIFKLVGCAHNYSVRSPYTCHFILQIAALNSLTGTIPTEIGMMISLAQLTMCKLSSFGFLGHRPCWVFLERIPIIFKLVGCADNYSVRSPYTCHFILQIAASNSLTGTTPTEIGMMTSLASISICKLSSFEFLGHRPCWVFLERIPIIFKLVGCADNYSVRSPYTCHFTLQISDQNSLTGTIPTEIGMMTSLRRLWMCKYSSYEFPWHRPCWVFLERIPIIFRLVGCAHNVSVRSPYPCHFIVQISDGNSLTGTLPTEIGMMTSLMFLSLCKYSSFEFLGHRPCWVFLERIPIIFKLVGCADNYSVRSPYTCHFILQISGSNSLTGTIPTEIGMMTSLTYLSLRKSSSFEFPWHRPCWVFLERIYLSFSSWWVVLTIILFGRLILATLFFKFQFKTPSPERYRPRLE